MYTDIENMFLNIRPGYPIHIILKPKLCLVVRTSYLIIRKEQQLY